MGLNGPLCVFQSSPDPKAGCYHRTPQPHCAPYSCFNPHPTRRPGATPTHEQLEPLIRVSILTRPEGRVLRRRGHLRIDIIIVSILTRPEGRMLDAEPRGGPHGQQVSILTRPEGRVLRILDSSGMIFIPVSILTRPEGRVLPSISSWPNDSPLFQSSPDSKAGCYATRFCNSASRVWFQSSPDPKAGCYDGSISYLPEPTGFNPHPTRRPGATVCPRP